MEKTCEIFNKDGQRAIDAKSIESLTSCVMDLPQTKLDYVNKDGEYADSRKKLHAEIIKEFKEGVVCIDKGKPIAILMGGSPASGKSTFLKKYRPYLLTDNLFKVDADEIRARLPEYKGWNAAQTHEETGDIVKTLISDKNIGVPCKFDFIYDGTMTSTKKYLSLIDLLKSEGYEVFVVFITNIPKKVVKKRALERYQKSGRFVPMVVIDDFYQNGDNTFDQVKKRVDGYISVDGSTFDYNIIEKGGKALPNKRIYEKLGHKLQFALGGAIGEKYESALLTPYQNESLNKIFENPIFNGALEITTFGSGGGFVHTMVLLSNLHVVTFNHEDDNIQYSYYEYKSLDDYLSEENMATQERGWDNEMYTPNSGMRVAEISRPTNKFFEKMKKTKSPDYWKNHGLEFIPYKDTEIMHTLHDDKYSANDMEFDTLVEAQKYIDSGETPWFIKGAMRHEASDSFEKGGGVKKETNQMFESQIVETKHHAKELDSLVDSKTEIEPWVLAKMTRAKTDLSDLTHYLDGQSKIDSKKSFGRGGSILDEYEEEQFQEWMDDGNVIEQQKGVYSTQDAQYSNRLIGLDALRKYFKKEFLSDSYNYGSGGNIDWKDAVIGDSALVISENKMGMIVKDYGRKFHLRFADGSEKTYDASELQFYKLGDEEYGNGGDVRKMDWFTMFQKQGLQVEIGSMSNDDLGDQEEKEIEFETISVKSIDEAKRVVKQFIEANDLGSGNFMGAQIYENGKPIAYISYNLRVWEGKVGDMNSEPYQYMSGGKVHFTPSDFYKLGGSLEEMTPVEAFFSQLDYSKLPNGFANYVKDEILTDPQLESVSENDPIFIEIKSKVMALTKNEASVENDENAETQEAIDLLNELAIDQEGAEKQETLEAIELLKELLV